MARQQVALPLLLAVMVDVAACKKPPPYEGAFQLPIAAAVLQPEVGGPYQEPIGFVANGHGGQITPLALKQGRFLDRRPDSVLPADEPPAHRGAAHGSPRSPSSRPPSTRSRSGPVTRSRARSCGSRTSTTASAPRSARVRRRAFGAPVEQRAYWDPVSEPETARLTRFGLSKGYTTTETWTVTFDGSAVVRSRAPARAVSRTAGDEQLPYEAEPHRVEFTIEARGDGPVAGDSVRLQEPRPGSPSTTWAARRSR